MPSSRNYALPTSWSMTRVLAKAGSALTSIGLLTLSGSD